MPRPTGPQLHRARREEEVRIRDEVLAVADTILSACEAALAKAALATYCGREPGAEIRQGQSQIRSARALLRAYFDQVG